MIGLALKYLITEGIKIIFNSWLMLNMCQTVDHVAF